MSKRNNLNQSIGYFLIWVFFSMSWWIVLTELSRNYAVLQRFNSSEFGMAAMMGGALTIILCEFLQYLDDRAL